MDFAIDTREDQNDTMHRTNNNDATHKNIYDKCFTKRQTNTTNGPKHATPSGEWLGLRAEEGRGKPRYRPG